MSLPDSSLPPLPPPPPPAVEPSSVIRTSLPPPPPPQNEKPFINVVNVTTDENRPRRPTQKDVLF